MSARRSAVNAFTAIAILFTFGCPGRGTRPSGADECAGVTTACTGHGSMVHDGRERRWRVHVPARAEGARLPVIVSLHGRLGTGDAQEELSHFDRVADVNGFAIVEPDGTDRSWADARGTTPAAKQGVDDVGFLAALVDSLPARYGTDPARVYVTGMSNGAFMATTFACAQAGKIAAIATVTGGFSDAGAASCRPEKPVPAMLVLGEQDPLVPFTGGEMGGRGVALSGPAMLETWARLNGCTGSPAPVALADADPSDGTTTSVTVRDGCRGGARVELWAVHGGGHTWPGGKQYAPAALIGRTSRDFDASERIVAFLASFRRD